MQLRLSAVRLLVVAASLAISQLAGAQSVDSLRVMTYNIWVGGNAAGLPLSRTAGVINVAQADVIGLQEVGGSGPALASMLGFYYHGFNSDLGILSRYPIIQTLSAGVKLQLSPTQEAYIFDAHLAAYPYQPYDFRDGLLTTEAQAIAAAQAARGSSAAALINGMSSALASGAPVFLTGDFNEPSHLDWTPEAASAGLNFGMKVDWPTSRTVTGGGLIDAFRELRPDEVLDRGETWTPGTPAPSQDPGEVHDRIDMVYYAGVNVAPTQALVLGYDANDPNTDVGIQPYPSDHRALVVQFDVPASFLAGDLNGDSLVNAADWMQLQTWQFGDLTGLTRSQAYSRGDLSGDFLNDHVDFVLFKNLYETAHGVGAFAQMLATVPEPGVTALAAGIVAALPMFTRERWRRRSPR